MNITIINGADRMIGETKGERVHTQKIIARCLAASALVAVGTAVFETRAQNETLARVPSYSRLQTQETCQRKQILVGNATNSGNALELSKPIKTVSSPYNYADTHSKYNQLLTQLPSFLSKNPDLGDIVTKLEGIYKNGHAHWAEKSITMVVDHLVKNERYADAKTFIKSIAFEGGDYADTHLKDDLLATWLPWVLSKNPELGKIVKMLDGIEQNGHAGWAEKSITTVVDHLVKNKEYDDAKTFIDSSITFKDGDYADTNLKDNLLATWLPSFLSKNPELGEIVKMLDGIEQNGHAHWAERSIAMVVDHLVENERYDDAKTFIDSITFKDGDYADTHLKDNLINMLPEVVKLERRLEQKHTKLPFDRTTVPGTTPLPN